jgi:enoyl-CoA hydratase
MAYETLQLAVDERVATVTLNRPKVLNALNATMVRELGEAFAALAADDAVRVVVLRGAGGKAFAAGADISELTHADAPTGRQMAESTQRVFRRIETMGKPVIACMLRAWRRLRTGDVLHLEARQRNRPPGSA